MAGFDADEVIIAPLGHVYVAPTGTAMPTTIASTLNGAWVDLGYLTEDGIQPTFGLETTDIRAWQSETPIRRIVNARTGSVAFSLMEWSASSVVLAFGGGTWTAGTVSGTDRQFSYTFPSAADSIAEYAFLFDAIDGNTHVMFCFYRATVSGDVSTQFIRGTAASLPVTLGLLADSTTGTIGKIVGTQRTAS